MNIIAIDDTSKIVYSSTSKFDIIRMTLEIVTKATGCIFDEYTIVTENDFTNPSWHDLHLKGEYTLLIF